MLKKHLTALWDASDSMRVIHNNLENWENLADNLSFVKLLSSHDDVCKS